jgi:hypothetical protein
MGRKYFLAVVVLALLMFSGCVQLPKTDFGKSDPTSSLQRPSDLKFAEAVPLWQKQADQLERLGDYNGACRVVRERYLRSRLVIVFHCYSLI